MNPTVVLSCLFLASSWEPVGAQPIGVAPGEWNRRVAGEPAAVVLVPAESGASAWLPPGHYLVEALGQWAPNAVDWVGPAGYDGRYVDASRVHAAVGQLLVLSLGRWQPWRRGAVIAHAGGPLRLRMHDTLTHDNLGRLSVKLWSAPRAPAAAPSTTQCNEPRDLWPD